MTSHVAITPLDSVSTAKAVVQCYFTVPDAPHGGIQARHGDGGTVSLSRLINGILTAIPIRERLSQSILSHPRVGVSISI